MHNLQNERLKTQNLSMHENGLRENRVYRKKSSRFCGEVVVVPSNVVPSFGFVREDFILVIITLSFLCCSSATDSDLCVGFLFLDCVNR